MINLILGFTWLVVALAIFAGNQINPRLDVRLAWFALLLAVFNVIRWRLQRPRSEKQPLFQHYPSRHKKETPPSAKANPPGPMEDAKEPPQEKS